MTLDNPSQNPSSSIAELCERGQRLLSAMKYLEAERVLAEAESEAWTLQQWEILARLCLPLQETRRQIRQRCGMGAVALRLLADGPDAQPDPEAIVRQYPQGQLLVAGWGSMEPARRIRQLAAEQSLYLETFLAAVYPSDTGRLIVIAPTETTVLPPLSIQSANELQAALPASCLMLGEEELPKDIERNSPLASSRVMDLWERLHRPLLAAADAQKDPLPRMQGYRSVIQVDRACELAHQKLSEDAREMARALL